MKAKRLPLHHRVGTRLAVVLLQLRLVVEQFELAGPAGHEQVDDVLCLGRKMSAGLASHRIRRAGGSAKQALIVQQRSERHLAETDAATAEEVAARFDCSSRSSGSMRITPVS